MAHHHPGDGDGAFDVMVGAVTGEPHEPLAPQRPRRSPQRRLLLAALTAALVLLAGIAAVWRNLTPAELGPLLGGPPRLATAAETATPTDAAVFASLSARPLRFPPVPSADACPASRGHQIDPRCGLAAGAGPF